MIIHKRLIHKPPTYNSQTCPSLNPYRDIMKKHEGCMSDIGNDVSMAVGMGRHRHQRMALDEGRIGHRVPVVHAALVFLLQAECQSGIDDEHVSSLTSSSVAAAIRTSTKASYFVHSWSKECMISTQKGV